MLTGRFSPQRRSFFFSAFSSFRQWYHLFDVAGAMVELSGRHRLRNGKFTAKIPRLGDPREKTHLPGPAVTSIFIQRPKSELIEPAHPASSEDNFQETSISVLFTLRLSEYMSSNG